jgi:hypothetical protein
VVFTRVYSYKLAKEFTQVDRHLDNDLMETLDIPDYPFKLVASQLPNVWPRDWSVNNQLKPRSSVYWPEKYEVLYIENDGDRDRSELRWARISDVNWYRNMKYQRLYTEARFSGLFYDRSNVYAIGNTGNDPESYMYLLREKGNTRELMPLVSGVHLRLFQWIYKIRCIS